MLEATLLGCGSSGGVPRVGGDWGVCDPEEPKNRRSRCSILVRYNDGVSDGVTTVLVDTSPDLREQLLRAGVTRVDALVFTHDHADQCHGIDDMRALAYRMRARVPTYMDAATSEVLMARFGYCFEMPEGRVHPPILEAQALLTPGTAVDIAGDGGVLKVLPIEVSHGPTPCLGLILDGRIAYTPDVLDIADEELAAFDGVEAWICDALRYHPHPTHAHGDRTLSWQARTGARQMVLTNLHIDMDYATLSEELPGRQTVGYDGLVVAAS